MAIIDRRTAQVLVTICVFAFVAMFLYKVRFTLVVFLFAILFAYLLEPIVSWFQRSPFARHSRGLAILEAYVVMLGLVTVLGILFAPRLVEDARHLSQSLPGLVDKVTSGKIIWQLGSRHGWSYDTQLRLEHFIADHRTQLLGWMGQLGTQVARSLQNIVWFFLIPILAIFFLSGGERMAEGFVNAFHKEEHRRVLRGIIQDLDEMLAHFVRTQLLLAGIALVVYGTGFALLRLPYTVVLAFVDGALEFIPVVGPLVAVAGTLFVAFTTGYEHLLLLIAFFGIWRAAQDYFITPRVMGGRLELHPLTAIAAVLMGGELGGILGVYFSIPIVGALRIVWQRWQRYSPGVVSPPPQEIRPVAQAFIKR